MLTPDELESWIAKRTAQSAESTSLHLWDWQAMCHLKAERDRLRSICSFNRLDLGHKPSYVLNCLYEGEISLAKACEWLRRYADGVTDPIVEGVLCSGGWSGSSPKELAAECDRLRERVAAAEESKIRLQWDLDTANAEIIERADEAARLRDTLQDSENIRHAEKQILLQEVQANKHLRDTLDDVRKQLAEAKQYL